MVMEGHNESYRKVVSTDQFKDMIKIVNEFGPVKLDGDESNQEKYNFKEQKEVHPLWFKLYEVMSYGPKRIKSFLDLVD